MDLLYFLTITDIPHFKDVVIMATNCDSCGHRSNEVKSGGGIEPKGVRIEIRVRGKEDFSRDVLKVRIIVCNFIRIGFYERGCS